VNPRLDQALMGGGKCHNHVTETTSFQREDLMNHGLHQNLLGKTKLILIAKCLGDKLSFTSSMTVITSAKASPY
jgi:hypothetical protein